MISPSIVNHLSPSIVSSGPHVGSRLKLESNLINTALPRFPCEVRQDVTSYSLAIVIESIAFTALTMPTPVSDHISIIESNDERSGWAVIVASPPEAMQYSHQM